MDAGDSARTIYSSATMQVTARTTGRSPFLVVTFQSLVDPHEPLREGFGEAFLAGHGIDAVHVVGRSNAWYQYADMPQAIAAIRAESQGWPEVVTYGLSMGAYAAVNFAGDLGAARAVAISPQFSVDPRKAAFESRWDEHVPGIRFCCDRIGRMAGCPTEVWAVYDPENLDRRHVDLIAARLRVRRVPVPFSGHPATAILSETGMLSSLVLDLLHGRHDPGAFAAALARVSPRTAAWHAGMAEALPRRAKARKVALYRKAAAIRPDDPRFARDLGVILHRAGEHEAAVGQLRRAWALDPTNPMLPFVLSRALARCGRPGPALEAAQAADRLGGGAEPFASNASGIGRALLRRRRWDRAVLGVRGAFARLAAAGGAGRP